ncbi:protein FAR1-RELATED SEQUENCE 5-like [Vicia villosa]|uniref:protein FAR1-RELATED SEQUENCE 5-like n=1 Tax=Vicia villosa TaxID=3911 RepID=UPI00273AA735|nr:protein FAR1-RELATED SEQUENCE 5-like [Vicia villosa]
MLHRIRTEATKLGFGVVIGRSDNGTSRRNAFVTLTCKRSEKYILHFQKLKRDDTGSRKCECPFRLRGYLLANNKWKFNVICGLHNHDLSQKLVSHPITCRLLPDEKTCVSDMTLSLVPPKNILASLKRKRPENTSNIKQVYNMRYQSKLALMGDCTEMQHLIKLLDENNYVCRHRRGDDGVTLRDIYWTHPDSIKLFNTFPTVLIIYSTYKTNKYILPLLEIVGVTWSEKTYFVGFSFLECGKQDKFAWALEVYRSMLKDQEDMFKVIVTNRDTSLMNLVATVFHTSYALLCNYHITKNVRSRVKPAVGTKKIACENQKLVKAKIMDAWNVIVNASIKEIYADAVLKFRNVCVKYPNIMKYVESTILGQVKEKFVCAWTTKRASNLGSDSSKCGCTILKAYGLPCACAIFEKMKVDCPIRMNEVSNHWKRLGFEDDGKTKEERSSISILTEWEAMQERFLKADDNTKLHIKERLRKIAFPKTTDLKPPSQPVKTNGT